MKTNRQIRLCLYLCASAFLLILINPCLLPAGMYGASYRRLRKRYSGNTLIFTVGTVTLDPSLSNAIVIISVNGDLIHLRKDIYEQWLAQHGLFRYGDRIKAAGSWRLESKGKAKHNIFNKLDYKVHYYNAYFIARLLELIERSEGIENQVPKLGEGEEEEDPGEKVSVHSDAAEEERARAIKANLAITGLKKKFPSHKTEHFCVYFSGDEKNALQAGRYFETLYAKFKEVMQPLGVPLKSPEEKMAAVIFKDYDEYARMTGINSTDCPGFFSPIENALYIYDFRTHPVYQERKQYASEAVRSGSNQLFWDESGRLVSGFAIISRCDRWIREMNAEVVIHEAVHQLCYNTGFFTQTGSVYPTWLVEGIALYFEHPTYWDFFEKPAGNINVECLQYFKQGLTLQTLIGFFDLLLPTTNFFHSFPGQTKMAYAQSWALFYYLIHGEDGKYQQGLGELVKYLNQLPEGVELKDSERIFHFRKFLKVHPLHFQEKWLAFMEGLREEVIFVPSNVTQE